MLGSGNYSIYLLNEDNTFQQITFRLAAEISEHDFQMAAEAYSGAFISFGVEPDPDCDPEYVVNLPI